MATHKISGVRQGYPLMLGANRMANGYNFAVEVPDGQEAYLLLYHKNSPTPTQEFAFEKDGASGEIGSLLIPNFPAKEYEYNFRINGKVVQDICAYSIRGREVFGEPWDTEDEHKVRCGFLSEKPYDWEGDCALLLPYEELVLYKLHVRGYTKQAKLPSREKGTFKGLIKMIPYWQSLGINAIELMPAYEFTEVEKEEKTSGMITRKRQEGKINYWGYQAGYYFSPKRSYCATKDSEKEFKDLVKALHKAGIECIMEMYFPGGTNPFIVHKVLQFWKIYYHVDGFHLLGDGVPADLIQKDKLLSHTKLMGAGMGNLAGDKEKGYRNLAEYNLSFLQDMRRFLKSDEDTVQGAAYHIRHNSASCAVVNYMACQDGFTLSDTVTYNYKHNEANGEDNNDGSGYNYSWNCGIEGPSRKLAVKQIRDRQLRNAFLMLLLSQGVPMIYGGDEIANSQDGNNNAYCQDNPVGWIDWKGLKKNQWLMEFVKNAIALRKEHPILHSPGELKGIDYKAKGFPDISFHGERAWYLNNENTCRLLGVMYCGAYAEKEDKTPDDFLYVAYNFHWETRTIALPNLPEGMVWKKITDTADEEKKYFREYKESYIKKIEIGPRTILVLIGKQEAEKE